ncbi:cobalamin biosynthesis protein [Nocardioides seonyuensis]|uniref:cobalamin biosynthesis protein n=1 Tax=Nocardioides seonyuensis TaxID=2518371 RepID=UPI00141EBD4F|nr:cobalamin biosynthesis protein [Nocardioides seonyuensis]
MSILVAWGLDATLAEPPLRLHPVAWAGRYLAAAGDVVPASPPARALLAGGAAWVAGAAVTLGAALAAESVIGRLPPCAAAPGTRDRTVADALGPAPPDRGGRRGDRARAGGRARPSGPRTHRQP